MYSHERSLVKRLAGKPFALIGVNNDGNREALKKVIKKENISWRSFWDGGSTGSPISSAWKIAEHRGWPGIFVLDHKGVIRFKDVSGREMDQAIDMLLKEMAQSASGKP